MGTVNLIKDTIYRGRVIIFYPSLVVTESKVKEELEKVGFTNVRVWLDSDDIPSDWPSTARSDVSSSMSTQAWLEAGWGKETGNYPSSGSKWQLNDYWVQKAAPVSQQPPPQPKEPEENGPPLLTCATEGMSCEQTPCCDGTTCRQDSDGYWGGGLRCMTGNSGVTPTGGGDDQVPIQVNEPPKSSSAVWWVVGALSVAGAIGAVALIKSRQDDK